MEKENYPCLLVVVLLMIYYSNLGVISTNITIDDDKSALLALKSNLLNLDPSHILYENWTANSSSSICSWVGVICGCRHNRVISLNISNMGLEGNLQLVPQLGNLSFLVSLNFSYNYFHGSLPQELTRLRRLRFVNWNYNNIGDGGSIPLWFGSSIPQLQDLRLRNNTFSGVIPPSLYNMSKLQILDLSDNHLHGEIPMEIGDIQTLRVLNIQGNEFKGRIPTTLFNLSNLEMLGLSDNRLSGSLPDNICQGFPKIKGLYLGHNELSGKIPENISACLGLQVLSLQINKFEGSIPKQIGNIRSLVSLYLGTNNLTGEVPASIFNISTLQEIELGWNQLTGNLPSNLGHGLPNLEYLQLSSNNFSVDTQELNFITSLTNCKNLNYISIHSNPINGRLPSSIGNLSSLEYLYAYESGLKGSIPHEIGNLSRLVTLNFFDNQLTGSLPESFGNLESLQGLNLVVNNIYGTIPSTMCKMVNLYILVLSENQIGNAIPDCIGNLTSLGMLWVDDNKLNASIPKSIWNLQDLTQLDLSSNFFSGSLAPEIGNLKVVDMIDLSNNQLSGILPATIGNLVSLTDLSLNHNKFHGAIPESIAQMVSLAHLDLSHNNLSGSIPSSLQKLKHLLYFNVSFNNLSGEIPSDGPFKNLSSQSFSSNNELCGDSKYNVPPCPIIPKKKTSRKLELIVVITSVGISLIVVVLSLSYAFAKHKTKKVASIRSPHWSIPRPERFSYYELLEATERYSESRLIGTGSFGFVYRATLRHGRDVAVKIFNLNSEGAYKSFEVECKILGQIRHKNLCKVIGSCSNQDFKALILEYMPGGSLEKLLYSHTYFLDLLQRISIMIDVASALEYLHYGYSAPIIHCDLKPSNVLLDENMVAHLSDFGISKLLDDGESTTRTMTLATMGYIAPEFGTDGLVSSRCDVYSYGILLMEVFTGLKPTNEMFAENVSLRSWVNDSLPNGIIHIVDSKSLKPDEQWLSEKLDCVSSILEIALHCSMESPSERINIKDVCVALGKIKLQLHAYY